MIKNKFVVSIYECVDRVSVGSDMELNESQTKEFWATAELVEHDAQKHPGDGWRMWEAVVDIDDLGTCLVTHSHEFATMWAVKYLGQWMNYQEHVGLHTNPKFIDPNNDEADREQDSLTCLWTTKEKAVEAMKSEEGQYTSEVSDWDPSKFEYVRV